MTKNFFDLSDTEKKKMIDECAQESNKMQKELTHPKDTQKQRAWIKEYYSLVGTTSLIDFISQIEDTARKDEVSRCIQVIEGLKVDYTGIMAGCKVCGKDLCDCGNPIKVIDRAITAIRKDGEE